MKKQVATWIVTGALVVGIGAAFAETQPSDPATGSDPTSTTVEETTTTTVEPTTTTTVEETTTTVEDSTNDTLATENAPTSSPTVAGDMPGNSWAAQNHDCDANWGNHGAWVSANAKAHKTGDTVPCDPNADQATTNSADATTSTTVEGDTTDTTDATVAPSSVTEQSTTRHGNGGGRGHGKKG